MFDERSMIERFNIGRPSKSLYNCPRSSSYLQVMSLQKSINRPLISLERGPKQEKKEKRRRIGGKNSSSTTAAGIMST
ncbi:hypothetical protein MA16_Dca012693 [Dendrobium catenatum]|uniref:Uncharacterized protein n=1 Tax=Dendrobium catenatum TaxID=906689 RepID=A0A2I0WPR0_9ASPA|nr:hypothetical protein MA16_Dca012693 [Dendrobium catenatum]